MMIRKGMFIGDRYEIIDKVGSGGMSDVYKALDHKLNRNVAVKILKDEFSQDKNFVSKFKVEAQSAAGLAHPNIVNVFDVGEDNGIYFIVMELVSGITLKKYIEKKGKLQVREAVSIAIQIAQGIEAAHNNHIIHRDIKPQNVIISREGKVKVTDFGIARAATSNTINSSAMGSVHYISPEQARGGYIDEKSDIYSLGITLYEMVTGRVPFEGDSTVTIALQHINEEIPSPKLYAEDLPVSVEKIIEKCTQKKPERRYLKVSSLIADLKKSLVTPDEDFVVMTPAANNNATIMITDEEVSIIRKGANAGLDSTGNIYDEKGKEKDGDGDDDFGDDDIDSVNPKLDKMVAIGAIVMSVVLLVVVALIMVNVFKGCGSGSGPDNETTKTASDAKKTVVPDVVGHTADDAAKILKNSKLGVDYKYEDSNDVEKGIVIRQSVDKDKEVDKNSTVTITVSNGPARVSVPPVEGMTLDEAKKMLEGDEYGFKVSTNYVPDEQIPADTCISTDPKAGNEVKFGASIKLNVSSGEDTSPVEVPDVTKKMQQSAKKQLEDLKLVVSIKEEYSDSVASGMVISQNVAHGSSVPKGTTVELVVSKGKKPEETSTPPAETTAAQNILSAVLKIDIPAGLTDGDEPIKNATLKGYVSYTNTNGKTVIEENWYTGTYDGSAISEDKEYSATDAKKGTKATLTITMTYTVGEETRTQTFVSDDNMR